MNQANQSTRPSFTVEDHPLTPALKSEAQTLLMRAVSDAATEALTAMTEYRSRFEAAEFRPAFVSGAPWLSVAMFSANQPDHSLNAACLASHLTNEVFRQVSQWEPGIGEGKPLTSLALKKAMLAHGLVYSFYGGPLDDGETADEFADDAVATGYGLAKVSGIDLYSFIKDYCETAIQIPA